MWVLMVRLRVEFTGLLTLTRTVSACLGSVAMPVTQSQHQSIQSRQRHEVQHPRPRQWQQQRPLNGGVAGWWFNNCSRSILNLEANAVWNAVTDAFVYDVVSSSMLVKLVD